MSLLDKCLRETDALQVSFLFAEAIPSPRNLPSWFMKLLIRLRWEEFIPKSTLCQPPRRRARMQRKGKEELGQMPNRPRHFYRYDTTFAIGKYCIYYYLNVESGA